MYCPYCGKDLAEILKAVEKEQQIWRPWDNATITVPSIWTETIWDEPTTTSSNYPNETWTIVNV